MGNKGENANFLRDLGNMYSFREALINFFQSVKYNVRKQLLSQYVHHLFLMDKLILVE